MSDSALTWLLGGVAVVLGLLLLMATSAPSPVAEVAEATANGEIGFEGEETVLDASGAYATYDAQQTVIAATEAPRLVGGCFSPDTPCGRHDCPVCPRLSTPAVATAPEYVAAGCVSSTVPCGQPVCPGCPEPVGVCAPSPCESSTVRALACGVPACGGTTVCVCGPTCVPFCPARPGINRNVPTCINECSFLQLNATIPQPDCSTICYRWDATRGTLINASTRDPLYFAPAVCLPCGEDVLITLTIVDAQGARYSDEIRLHVRNLP